MPCPKMKLGSFLNKFPFEKMYVRLPDTTFKSKDGQKITVLPNIVAFHRDNVLKLNLYPLEKKFIVLFICKIPPVL